MKFTKKDFEKINIPKAIPLVDSINESFELGKINTVNRILCMLPNLLHESGDFRWLEEIASGVAYEGRKDLGNIEQGDGPCGGRLDFLFSFAHGFPVTAIFVLIIVTRTGKLRLRPAPTLDFPVTGHTHDDVVAIALLAGAQIIVRHIKPSPLCNTHLFGIKQPVLARIADLVMNIGFFAFSPVQNLTILKADYRHP